jgi:hypothetical protein
MLADTKNLFDPSKRGSIAFDIEGHPDCYLSVCVVVLDDFHLFSFQEPALARYHWEGVEGKRAERRRGRS